MHLVKKPLLLMSIVVIFCDEAISTYSMPQKPVPDNEKPKTRTVTEQQKKQLAKLINKYDDSVTSNQCTLPLL